MSEPVSLQEMADFFGCDPRWITDLAKKGVVIRVGHGKYDLIPSAKNYIAFLRSKDTHNTESDINLPRERGRLCQAQADKIEIENAARRKELLNVDQVLTIIAELQTIYNNGWLGFEGVLPGEIVSIAPDVEITKVKYIVQQVIYGCRVAVANEIATLADSLERESVSESAATDSTVGMG